MDCKNIKHMSSKIVQMQLYIFIFSLNFVNPYFSIRNSKEPHISLFFIFFFKYLRSPYFSILNSLGPIFLNYLCLSVLYVSILYCLDSHISSILSVLVPLNFINLYFLPPIFFFFIFCLPYFSILYVSETDFSLFCIFCTQYFSVLKIFDSHISLFFIVLQLISLFFSYFLYCISLFIIVFAFHVHIYYENINYDHKLVKYRCTIR